MQAQIPDVGLHISTVLEPRVDWATPVSHVHFSVGRWGTVKSVGGHLGAALINTASVVVDCQVCRWSFRRCFD